MSEYIGNIVAVVLDFFGRIGTTVKFCFNWLAENPTTWADWYTSIVRWIFPILALAILLSVLREMLRVKNPTETWAYLHSDDMGNFPVNHWECTIGRAKHCDVVINYPTVSRTQCALIRDDDGKWTVHNLSEKNPVVCNGREVRNSMPIKQGQTLTVGGITFTLEPISEIEHEIQQQNRLKQSRPAPPWGSFAMLTLFQFLTVVQYAITRGEHINTILACYSVLTGIMWVYVLVSKIFKRTGFEPEILAFFACTLNLAVTASSAPSSLIKQTACIVAGIFVFLILGWYLRDLKRVIKARYFMALTTVGMLMINLIFGSVKYGAQNWITIGGFSVQPSEFAKVCFIFAGAATLERLFVKRNLWGFMLLSGFCLGALAIMSDFGTAAIFFVVFLVIAYLRSGDFATLSLICGGAVAACGLVLRFKPYIASRFAVWGHAWENVTGSGYQQAHTMSAAASGGMIGMGPGNGWLHNIAASNTDLVFGFICEEWGLIIALLTVAIIVTLSVFAFRVTKKGRSSFYTIAACAATSLLVFQTILNVFGSVDLLPLTGVTFPFVSCGGSSMISSWGLLAFLKAADTRENASFAVRRLPNFGEFEELERRAMAELERESAMGLQYEENLDYISQGVTNADVITYDDKNFEYEESDCISYDYKKEETEEEKIERFLNQFDQFDR